MKTTYGIAKMLSSDSYVRRPAVETKEREHIAPASQVVRNSGLYHFVATLRSRSIASPLDGFKVIPLETVSKEYEGDQVYDYTRKAYVVNFPALAPKDFLDEKDCFELKHTHFIEHHLDIDALFAPGSSSAAQNRFPYCHYTQNFQTPDGSYITVHLHISRNGKIEHFRVKSVRKITGADGETFENIENYPENILKQLQPWVEKHAEIALQLIKKLNQQKLDEILAIHDKINKSDHVLSGLFLELHNDTARQKYLRVAKKLTENINKLNKLSDSGYIDVRNRHPEQICSHINAGKFTSQTVDSIQEDSAEIPEAVSEGPTAKEHKLAPSSKHSQKPEDKFKQKIDAQRKQLLTELEGKEKQLDKLQAKKTPSVAELITRNQVADTLRSITLSLYCLPKNDQVTIKRLNKVEEKLAKVPSLLQEFEELAKLGELDKVLEIFPHIESSLNASFLIDLLDDVIWGKNPPHLEKQIEVCNFLHKKSDLYRVAFEKVNQTFNAREGENLALSQLVLTSDKQNKLAFEMLLRQGVEPNAIGGIFGETLIPQTFAILMTFQENPDIYYIQTLLAYGASTELPKDYFNNLSYAYHHVRSDRVQHINLNPNVDPATLFEYKMLSNATSILYVACRYSPTKELIALLAPKSSLQGLLLSLAYFSFARKIEMQFLSTSAEAGLQVSVTDTECENKAALETLQGTNDLPASMFLLNIVDESDESLKGIMEIMVGEIKRKMLEHTPEEIQKLKEDLMSLTKEERDTNDFFEKRRSYSACLYLHAFNPKPRIADKKDMAATFVGLVSTFLKFLNTSNINRVQRLTQIQNYCVWAQELADAVIAREPKLAQDPVFKTVLPGLSRIASQKLEAELMVSLSGPTVSFVIGPGLGSVTSQFQVEHSHAQTSVASATSMRTTGTSSSTGTSTNPQ